MQFPRIHSNGTNGRVLLNEYLDAITALENVLKAVSKITVHGRDYYTISSTAASTTFAKHIKHLQKLTNIKDELTEIALNIQKQLP